MNIILLNFLKSQTKPILRRALAKVIYEPEAGKYATWTKRDIDKAERQLREDTMELIENGHPVLSGQSGIYYSEKISDIEGQAAFNIKTGLSNMRRGNRLNKIAQSYRDRQQITLTERTDR